MKILIVTRSTGWPHQTVTVTDVTPPPQVTWFAKPSNVGINRNKGSVVEPKKVQNAPFLLWSGSNLSDLYTVVMIGESTQNHQLCLSLNTCLTKFGVFYPF